MIEFRAPGYIEVWRGDTFISRHRVEREAIESIAAAGAGEYELRFPTVHVICRIPIAEPNAPEISTPTVVSASSLLISLARAAGGPVAISDYVLERGEIPDAMSEIARGPLIFDYTDTGLTGNTRYYYRAYAVDNTGRESAYSATVSQLTTPASGADLTAPPAPTLNAASVAGTNVTLTWNAVTDPTVGGEATSGLKQYNVRRDGVYIGSTTTESYVDAGLSAATYSYTVRSEDVAGNKSGDSNAVSAVVAATPPSVTIKWHPGHYALPGASDSDATKLSLWDDIDSSGGWQGGHVRYFWGELESTLGNYNFAKITSDRDRLASHGLKLVIQIQIADFGSGFTTLGRLAPSYLAGSEYGGGAAYLADRRILRVWDAAVVTRLIALDTALAAQFEDDATVSGFVLAETALGAVQGEPGYTNANFHTQLYRRISAGEVDWPTTPRFVYFNWLLGTDSDRAALGAYCASHTTGLGGPDIKPPELFDGMEVYTGAIGGVDYRGVVPACYANQSDSVNGWSISALYNYALNPLQTNYLNTFVRPNGAFNTWASIKAFVAANPSMVSTLPSVYD